VVLYSVRVRVVRDVPGAMEWAKDISRYVQQKHGVDVECFGRVGAGQEIVWTLRFPDMGALEKYLAALEGDSDYHARIKANEEVARFETSSIEWGVWRKAF
jgi:hypothetical protein